MARSRKSNKKLLLLKTETTFNVDAVPSAADDAVLAEELDYQLDVSVLERANIKPTWSKDPHATGRKLARITFTVDVRSNGLKTGVAADESMLGRILRHCGLSRTLKTAVGSIGPSAVDVHTTEVTWGAPSLAAYTGEEVVNLYMEVVTPGASGVATIKVTSDNPTAIPNTAATMVTTGTPFDVGDGITFTPTFTGALAEGQAWMLTITPEGCMVYKPDSEEDNHDSATLYAYMDGTLLVVTGAYGTAELTGEVNGYGKMRCEFLGQYYEPVDAALPSPTFERSKPAQIELAKFRLDGFAATVSRFSLDLANEILPRLDANGADGYNGTYIGDRNPTGGCDPEATLVADQNFWKKLAQAKSIPVTYRFGTVPGNIVHVRAPAAQYTGLTYSTRDRIQTFDAGLAFRDAGAGDDEFVIIVA